MKKFYLVFAVLAIAALALSACGGASADVSEDNCASEEVLCVGLVTDVGEIDDKSFNQSAWEGVEQAVAELGAFSKYVETKDAKDYAANIGLFAEKDYDVIVTVGFAMGDATLTAAAEYPEIDFIGVDQGQWGGDVANVAGLIFPEDKAGFLAGALAAQVSETGTIAAVLGTDLVPPVVAFKEGYEAGALYINPNINLISTYHPGGMDVAFVD
ncbi:MAG: BMP family ABC transporter substrate-binding protein, partial [Anaerolineae bacterium]|nr:BMP family ABC transporter substrate-binding protein [Anaerolineae bacterium]